MVITASLWAAQAAPLDLNSPQLQGHRVRHSGCSSIRLAAVAGNQQLAGAESSARRETRCSESAAFATTTKRCTMFGDRSCSYCDHISSTCRGEGNQSVVEEFPPGGVGERRRFVVIWKTNQYLISWRVISFNFTARVLFNISAQLRLAAFSSSSFQQETLNFSTKAWAGRPWRMTVVNCCWTPTTGFPEGPECSRDRKPRKVCCPVHGVKVCGLFSY